MKIVKIASVAITVMLASVLASCTKEKEKEVVPETPVSFTVQLNKANADYAEVVIRHDGTEEDPWFGFVTTDLKSSVEDLISAQLSAVNAKNLHYGKTQTVAVRNLEEYVTYRYIAFGINPDGDRYGEPGSLAFNSSPVYDVTFQAQAEEVKSHQASFVVSHDGIDVLTYMAFLTDDVKTEAAALAADHYASIIDDEGKLKEGVELLKGTSSAVSYDELDHESEYRLIVYGVFENNDLVVYYGTPADVKVTTPIDLSLVTFSGVISGITTESAKATVTYEAKDEELTWYGFVTENLTSPATDLIATAIAGISEADYKTGKNKVLDLTGLTIETDYRFIVTGVNADGAFGVPADVEFSTLSEAYANTVFQVVATEIKPTSVTLTITHNGEEEFGYYGFLTDDLTGDVADIAVPAIADANLMTGKEKTVTIDNLSALTKYRYVVVGRINGNDYGTRGDVVFETGDYAVAASYEDFLGSWTMTVGNPYDFVVEAKVEGESYTISGLNGSTTARYGIGTPLVVEGKFVDGKLTIATQAISEKYVDPSDNKTYIDMFCGRYVSATDGNTYFDSNVAQVVTIFALLEDGTIEVRPGVTKDNEVYTSFRFYQVPESGSAYAQDTFGTSLPNLAKRPVPASEAYNKWLGKWTIGGIEMQVTKKESDVSYLVYGFYSSYYAELLFDSATGNMVFHHKEMDYSVNSSAGTSYTIYTTGINSLNYVAVRQGDDTSLAVFSLNSDGTTGNVTGVTYTHSQGETTVTEIGLYGYATSWTKWNGWNYMALPCTITKSAGTSSVSSPASVTSIPGIDVRSMDIRRTKEAETTYCRNQK